MTIQDLRDKGLMLFEVISGSRAYGTHKPTSDTDYRGVYILPQENLYGFKYI
jgi:predicted nucleotidyltransferase